MRRNILPLILCLAPVAAQAQTTVRGPVAGVVFDRQSHSLRPMVGVPGASYLGAAVAVGLDEAAVSPDGTMALAVSQGRLLLLAGLRELSEGVALDGAIEGVDAIAWSPDGNLAAVYSSHNGRAQMVRELRKAPAPGAAIDFAPAALSLAASNEGDLLAGAESGVYLLAPGSSPRLILAAERPAALTIRGTDLYVADSAAGRIWQVANFAASPAASVFADGVPSPAGVQVSADGRRLFAASAGEKEVRVFDVVSRAAAGAVALDFAPSELRAFGSTDVWLLNSNGDGKDPLHVATGSGEPAAWFVPAGREQ